MKRTILLTLLVTFSWIGMALGTQQESDAEKTKEPPIYALPIGALKFRNIGPALTSGRIGDFAVNPDNSSEYYVAAASGGVWKTINKGITFEPIFDSQGSFSIGCITMDPNNHNVIWVGTGENNNQRSVGYGDGVYKSMDGGKSWKNMGLKESEHIGMIAVHPEDSDTILVAAYGPLWSEGGERGLYKTTDGGKNWEAVLTISEHTGVSEVHLDPRDPDLIYAVAHQRRRHTFTFIDGGPESAVHKSTDGGKTWRKLTRGLPSGHVGRIGLAVSPPNPDVVYAIVEAQTGKGGFFRSTDRGETWEKRGSYATSGNYYQEIFADPTEVDRVYSMNTRGQVTKDGGATWSATGEKNKHVDNHALWIDPDNPDYLLNGNDGGIYESYDRGQNWRFMPNLSLTQFYKVSIDQAEPFYNVYGGTQDNYSLGGPSRTTSRNGITNEDWFVTQGGDGFETQVDPLDSNIIYAQSQHGNLNRFDRRSGESVNIKPREEKGQKAYNWNWDSPLLISPHSHTRLYFAADYVFRSDNRGDDWERISEDLTRQVDRNTFEVMGQIWPMDAIAKHSSTSKYGAVVALDESPLDEGLLFAGSDDGLIHVSLDGGLEWDRYEDFPGVPPMTYVNELLASKHDRNTVFSTFNNHKRGDYKAYVMKSNDRGQTWSSIASNLPERGTVYALAEDHLDPNLLFAGTEFGVFYTLDGGEYWKKLGSGLPTIAVKDMAIHQGKNDLVLGTFGRGFYVLDDYSALRGIDDQLLEEEARVMGVSDGLMFLPTSRIGGSDKGFQGETFFATENPDVGAKITYYYKESLKTQRDLRLDEEKRKFKEKEAIDYPTYDQYKAEEEEEAPQLMFTILDSSDNIVRHLRSPARKGINRINWDLRFPNITSAGSAGGGRGGRGGRGGGGAGIFVLPGTYKVFMSKSVNGEITKLTEPVPFGVTTLDNRTFPVTDPDMLLEFQNRLMLLSQALNGARGATAQINEQITAFRAAIREATAPTESVKAAIDALEGKLEEVQLELSGDRDLGRLDMDSMPSISDRVNSALAGTRSITDPTETQRKVYAIVAEEFDPLIAKINGMLDNDIPAIGRQLDSIGAPWTPGRRVKWNQRPN